MNEIQANTIAFSVFVLSIAIFLSVVVFSLHNETVEKVKAGLQECYVNNNVIWQKECKDENNSKNN